MIKSNSITVYKYYNLLRNLDPDFQLELIELLSKSLRKKIHEKKKSISHLFGAWEGDESPDEIIKDIRQSRRFNRKIDEF